MNEYDPNTPSDRPNSGHPGVPPQPAEGQIRVAVPQSRPVVTYVIIGLTLVVFLIQLGTQYLLGQDLPALYGSKINQLIAEGQYWRLFTPMLLHGSILHFGFNMYALYILGPGLERYYGHWRYLALYIVSGFAGNVFSLIFTPAPSLGSSTAIFGILAAEAMFFYQNRSVLGSVSQRALLNIILVAGLNFLIGLAPGIDNWGHLGGFIAGGMFAFLSGPLLELVPSYPGYELRDQRSSNAWVLASIVTGGFFAFLAVMTLYFF